MKERKYNHTWRRRTFNAFMWTIAAALGVVGLGAAILGIWEWTGQSFDKEWYVLAAFQCLGFVWVCVAEVCMVIAFGMMVYVVYRQFTNPLPRELEETGDQDNGDS